MMRIRCIKVSKVGFRILTGPLIVCTALMTAQAQGKRSLPAEIPADWHPGVSGTVTDQSRAILPGVTVRVQGIEPVRPEQTARTDQSGRYFVRCLGDGLYDISFSLESYFESSVRFQYSYPDNLYIDQILTFSAGVTPRPTINYVVVDKKTGLPISGAAIETEGIEEFIQTDRCGQAWDGKLGTNVITVRKEGYHSARKRVELGPKDRINLVFELEPVPGG